MNHCNSCTGYDEEIFPFFGNVKHGSLRISFSPLRRLHFVTFGAKWKLSRLKARHHAISRKNHASLKLHQKKFLYGPAWSTHASSRWHPLLSQVLRTNSLTLFSKKYMLYPLCSVYTMYIIPMALSFSIWSATVLINNLMFICNSTSRHFSA